MCTFFEIEEQLFEIGELMFEMGENLKIGNNYLKLGKVLPLSIQLSRLINLRYIITALLEALYKARFKWERKWIFMREFDRSSNHGDAEHII